MKDVQVAVAVDLAELKEGGEADIAMKIIKRLRPLTPGAQCLAYDMALHGVHKNVILQEHGLIPIVKVPSKEAWNKALHRARVPKNTHIEDKPVLLRDGSWKLCRVHAIDGAVGLAEVDDKGDPVFLRLKRFRIQPKFQRGRWCWYVYYRIPAAFGGGGVLVLRHDMTPEDKKRHSNNRPFNRTENLSVIPYDHDDEEVRQLYGVRQDAEAIHRSLEDSLWIGRAHSRGHLRQHMNLIGFGLVVNSLALHLAAARRAPPIAPAA